MAVGALLPIWRWQILVDGEPAPGAKLYTYLSGTSTPQAVYTTSALTVERTNPVVADADGVFPVMYLAAVAYRMSVTDSTGTVIYPEQDGIFDFGQVQGLVPSVSGTAGEALTAGNICYLSDGSGALVAGRWYKADADLAYSSTLPILAFVQATTALGATGRFQTGGSITLSGPLVPGSTYYVSATAGAITATAPSRARAVGVADTTTSIIINANPAPQPTTAPIGLCEGRLTLTSGTPVTVSNVTAAVTAYFTPYQGNQIALYDGTATWNQRTFSEIAISLVGFTASKPYDVFAYDNAGTVTLETLVWTNTTTRATLLTTQDGVLVKTGATTRRYLGTIYINASGGQTDDSATKRYVYNYTARANRSLLVQDPTDTWTYSSATIRQANGSTANQVEIMNGVADSAISLMVVHQVRDSAQENLFAGIGEDSTTAKVSAQIGGQVGSGTTGVVYQIIARADLIPAVGYHYYAWLEADLTGGGTATWIGDNGSATTVQSGLSGQWKC